MDFADLRDRQGRGTMAALSGLLKTWVTLQTLCLALAQVVSGDGEGPVRLRFISVFKVEEQRPWKTGWQDLDIPQS